MSGSRRALTLALAVALFVIGVVFAVFVQDDPASLIWVVVVAIVIPWLVTRGLRYFH